MSIRVAQVTILVDDYDAAIAWYRERLGFRLIEDRPLAGGKRWVVVAPPGDAGARLLLARARGPRQRAGVGAQAGDRVFLFLETDDFWSAYRRMSAAGVAFRETPREEPYGTVAVFADLSGNLWDLIEPAPRKS
ncbi:VOC family protein [Aquibium sp. A9E412]|uniref:VOC family protein n=1 Tax=Aquibium sp. A9E412 TaxID=2976767 RepID=UPI0025B0E4CC|nr:VOC family protein [Aquibium sp. A9E412]MDN2565374.1 VOC family protein [Aquibium sp. A9E412]